MQLMSKGRSAPTHRRSIDDVLDDARSRLVRVAPRDAWQLSQHEGALIIDIRTPSDRFVAGAIPGSLHLREYCWSGAWIRQARSATLRSADSTRCS